ncbi:hypothetical protein AW27_033750 (plasmid) [Streptomyces sp. PCS3-D2]|uniref:hypothetical protein n=1 Tax=Streptomyces sp. PCS3-D2 TaxID=1460244 RepID=UPI000449D5EC|nr:hypothetical protein [Streptomyces sp. PCS3-D2]WKV76527.1 hypothetical protein AW27_033750 [Streptomyces sp. PCS3-D2]
MTRGWKITVAVAGIVSTPLLWLLNSPDTGQLVGASVQATVAIAALVWALFQQPFLGRGQGLVDMAVGSGKAEVIGGGRARTGVRRPAGEGSGSATAERTGNARAEGPGSEASTGVEYT